MNVAYADVSGEDVIKADLVIAADGSTSSIRSQMLPNLQRTYAGYATRRGTVLKSDVSKETRELLVY
jgi:2-polyprenyl-6-methoxyphenol hydroxylase-like FAD-dependent oxidoreductase